MEAIKIQERSSSISWNYDEEADVLYLSAGPPRPAVGIDIGDGLVLRYDEALRKVVGLTVIGLRDRLVQNLGGSAEAPSVDHRANENLDGLALPGHDE